MRSCWGEVSSCRRGASLATHSARDLCGSAGGEQEKAGGDGGGVRTELSVPDDGGVGAVYRDLRHGGGGRHFLLQRSEIIIDAQTVVKWAPG